MTIVTFINTEDNTIQTILFEVINNEEEIRAILSLFEDSVKDIIDYKTM